MALCIAVIAIRLALFTLAKNFCVIFSRVILYWFIASSKSGVDIDIDLGAGVGFDAGFEADVGFGFGFGVKVASANEADGVARSIANPRASAAKGRGFIG